MIFILEMKLRLREVKQPTQSSTIQWDVNPHLSFRESVIRAIVLQICVLIAMPMPGPGSVRDILCGKA